MSKTRINRLILEILVLWGCWLLISFSLTDGMNNPIRFVSRSTPTLIGFIIIILINSYYLFPKFYLKKKQLFFVVGGILLLAGTLLLLHHYVFPWVVESRNPPPRRNGEGIGLPGSGKSHVKWMKELTPLIIAFLGSTLVEITRVANRKEKEKLAAELKFLKSQVNPHFLFNALNNIYSLSVVQAPQTSESVMQLSEILRYMVYDSNEEKVPLKSEIKYIENFVELHLLKDSRGMDVKLDLDKSASHVMVAPLLFIPFVENAFKHSKIENLKTGFIKIRLQTNDNQIAFHVVNSVPKNNFTKDEVGGVGLENTQKRLDLLYPGDLHELTIHQREDQFEVYLKITV